jgi:hypothetical protein
VTALLLFKNNASSRLYAAIDAATSSIRVQDGHGARFPQPVGDGSDYFMVTLEDRRSGQIEICKCTGRSGDILNVARAQESTIGQAFALGATVSNRFTAGTMVDYFNYGWDRDAADARFINVTGDTATGPIILPAPDPVQLHEAAHKDYVDKKVLQMQQVTVSAEANLVYQATAGQTIFYLLTPDIYNHTYQLVLSYNEPVDVFVAGLRKVENNAGGVGDFTVNRPANQIVLDVGATVGQFVQIDVYRPKPVPIPGAVSFNLLKPMLPDGTTTQFEMRLASDNSLVQALDDESVLIFVNNVPQKPAEDYTAFAATLTFTEAPEADADVWGVWLKS